MLIIVLPSRERPPSDPCALLSRGRRPCSRGGAHGALHAPGFPEVSDFFVLRHVGVAANF